MGFKNKFGHDFLMRAEHASNEAGWQEYLDHVSRCDLSQRQQDWLQVDVRAMFSSTPLVHHELESSSGESLLFFSESIVMLCPQQRILHHFPRHLIHCFVEDRRHHAIRDDDVLFRAEIFSISPLEEQLCWVTQCEEAHEIPSIQQRIARWMRWLNRA